MNFMKSYRNLYPWLCSYENLELAFKRARVRKTLKPYVIEFESELKQNLKQLNHELENFTYTPSPLTTFIVYDPKTRKISASHFRDRVVHHALCNIIAPIFEKDFIFDSFANRKGKGTHPAIKRFEQFLSQTTIDHKQTIERERERESTHQLCTEGWHTPLFWDSRSWNFVEHIETQNKRCACNLFDKKNIGKS